MTGLDGKCPARCVAVRQNEKTMPLATGPRAGRVQGETRAVSSYDRREWKKFLSALAKRDAPVELVKRQPGEDEKRTSYRSRLFCVEKDGSIIVERPDQAVTDNAFIVGRKLDLLLVLNNQRMIGDCELKKVEVRQINKDTRVTCYRLGPAARPCTEQRRGFFRINTAAADLGQITLKPIGQDHEIKARMNNLGGGGIGVAVRGTPKRLKELREANDFLIEMTVQEDNTELRLCAKLIHITPLDTTGLYLGLRFVLPEGNDGRELQNKLVQYTTWLQRRQLQKRRA